ncbi:MAG: hypothetical protein CVU60_17265 [Deltaproteobacteria bacterium HGW-Deltaproteobacteria-18]|nr:MAG: hypothetical protein CVU60_17265 [Deltaproteobacteria bacterium HGW-Deltaproteobacteria-18]
MYDNAAIVGGKSGELRYRKKDFGAGGRKCCKLGAPPCVSQARRPTVIFMEWVREATEIFGIVQEGVALAT